MKFENAIVVINKTRLESLIERFNTKAQAKFYIDHAGGDFAAYEDEHATFHTSLRKVMDAFQHELNVKVLERKFIANFLFSEKDLVVVVGQDGLVANTAKYVNGLPILAINPDASRYDGVLLPYDLQTFERGWQDLLSEKASYKEVTLAQAQSNDGQRLLAFNDLFIGPATHTSARYAISYGDTYEEQSSSGIIVSTGAGSTGWLSSVMNMATGVTSTFAGSKREVSCALPWNTDKLAFVVREPFLSRHSGVQLTAGFIRESEKLSIESHMPFNGVVFSDGIESDFIRFNSGSRVEIGIAPQKAVIVVSR